jgi:hypothetical protein
VSDLTAPAVPVLLPGRHLWTYDKAGVRAPHGGFPDPAKLAADAHAIRASGVLIHAVGTAAPSVKYADRARAALAGLQVTIAIGSRGPAKWEGAFADPAIAALRGGFTVMLDWEIAWSSAAGQPAALHCVDKILAAVPDAVGRVTDCPWWAPLYYVRRDGTRQATHPHAPTREFGLLCKRDRYPQAYGAAKTADGETPKGVQGRSLAMLRWARDASQYPALGTPAASVFPTFQLYARTTHDVVTTCLAEPAACLWQWTEFDPEVARGIRAADRLGDLGFKGATAIRDFQRAAGLTPDGIVGPRTLAALGVT